MRRIVVFNRVTADGYFAGPDGNLDWIVPDKDFDKEASESIARGGVDTILFGRRTYELFESFWPHALDDSPTSPDPHDVGQRSPEMRAMAIMLNETPKLVFSKTLKKATWKNSHLLRKLDPRAIEVMKRKSGGDIIVFGSGSIVSQLTQHGLIDEYQLLVTPTLLGNGKPLVSGLSTSTALTLEEAKGYPSGNVLLRYSRRT